MHLRPEAKLISRCTDRRENNSEHMKVIRDWATRWFEQGRLNQFEFEYLQVKLDEKEYYLEEEKRRKFEGWPHIIRRAERIKKDEEGRQKSHLRIVKTATEGSDPQT